MSKIDDLLERVHSPGPFQHWRLDSDAEKTEGRLVYPTLARVAQGAESYAQAMKRAVAEGDDTAARMAMQGMVKHLATLAEVIAPEAAEALEYASGCCEV